MTRRLTGVLLAVLLVVLGVVPGVVLAQLVLAGPAAAHAELVNTTPANGAELTEPPQTVTLEFTESVELVADGIRLLDADGARVDTPDPEVDGAIVTWDLPDALPDGQYLVDWRVAAADSHPIAGAFSFAVGRGVTVEPVVADQPPAVDAPWQLMVVELGGYLGFALTAGVVVFAAYCWVPARDHARTQLLLRVGLTLAMLYTLLALLLQGPYAAGRPLTELLDRGLLSQTAASTFGGWTQLRFFVLVAMAAVLWPRGALESPSNRWIGAGGVAACAATFSGTAHAAASGAVVEQVVDAVHVLAAGVWVGGLLVFAGTSAARGDRPGTRALRAFSRIALVTVAVLVASGTTSSLYRLPTLESLWDSTYGRVLLLKLGLVAAALLAAAVSRRRLHRGDEPWRSVRLEAAATVTVLAVTAVLASVTPPATRTPSSAVQERADRP